MDRREALCLFSMGALALATAGCGARAGHRRVAIVAKFLGNGFYNAVHAGADEAAKALGNVEIIFTGPPTPTAEGQIGVIDSLIAQHVDAIAVAANDPDALIPSLKRAMDRGIKVISFDSAVAPEGRLVHLGWSSDQLIGQSCLDRAVEGLPGGKGKFAILSATPTSTNQNAWIAVMKQLLPKYPGLELAAVVYGDDVADKSYREASALFKAHPDVGVIVAPTTVGILSAAQAVQDAGLVGKVYVTGCGLPSELKGYVKSGAVKSFSMGNPQDLGYATVQLLNDVLAGAKAGPGATLPIGRMGSVTFDGKGEGPMAPPMRFDAANIDQYAKVF